MTSPVALDVAAVRAGSWALLIGEGMFAAFHMTCRTLLHLLSVMAGILDVLVAELALHDSLLRGINRRPT